MYYSSAFNASEIPVGYMHKTYGPEGLIENVENSLRMEKWISGPLVILRFGFTCGGSARFCPNSATRLAAWAFWWMQSLLDTTGGSNYSRGK